MTTLSEPAIKPIRYMQFFEFFDPDMLDERILLADLGGAVRESPERTITELSLLVQQHESSVIAKISFVADNLIQLRYVEVAGRLERGMSVIKARGVKHGTSLHLFEIGKGGARVATTATRARSGVLSGQTPQRRRSRR